MHTACGGRCSAKRCCEKQSSPSPKYPPAQRWRWSSPCEAAHRTWRSQNRAGGGQTWHRAARTGRRAHRTAVRTCVVCGSGWCEWCVVCGVWWGGSGDAVLVGCLVAVPLFNGVVALAVAAPHDPDGRMPVDVNRARHRMPAPSSIRSDAPHEVSMSPGTRARGRHSAEKGSRRCWPGYGDVNVDQQEHGCGMLKTLTPLH